MPEYSGRTPLIIEFVLVVLLAFGLFLLASFQAVFSPAPAPTTTPAHLDGLVMFECLVLLIAVPLLKWRGWTRDGLGLAGRAADIPAGVGLALLVLFAYPVLLQLAAAAGFAFDGAETTSPIASHVGLGRVITLSLVNGFYEELFVCGYVVSALKDRTSPWFAINVSTALRLSYHLYQGGIAVVGVLPLGLLFALWFARTGRLWPLVLAHVILDVAALARYA
jgi:membrane protease YdiL (CAAX protease family)